MGVFQVGCANDGPIVPKEACLVGVLWLMRGAEGRSVLGDQVVFGQSGTTHAGVCLAPADVVESKQPAQVKARKGHRHVSVKAIAKVVQVRRELNRGLEDLLVPTQRGTVVTHGGLCSAVQQVLNRQRRANIRSEELVPRITLERERRHEKCNTWDAGAATRS